jgi:hypothetical protein
MLYTQLVRAKENNNSALSRIWIAAHFEKRLSRNHIFSTNIVAAVNDIIGAVNEGESLRVSGNLMLGLARIYNRKVKFLMTDCTEALWKIKLAFTSSSVNAVESASTAHNIDDARYFGQLIPDSEFPDLVTKPSTPLRPPAPLLSSRSHRSTIGSQQDTTEPDRYSYGYGDPHMLVIPSSQASPVASKSSVSGSRYSDVELPRQQQQRMRTSLERRSQRSSRGAMIPFTFDEEVPAIQPEDIAMEPDISNNFGGYNIEMDLNNNDIPPWEVNMDMGEPVVFNEPPQQPFDESVPAVDFRPETIDDQEGVQNETVNQSARIGAGRQRGRTVTEKYQEQQRLEQEVTAKKKNKGKPAKKVRLALLDDQIELPNRVVKEVTFIGPCVLYWSLILGLYDSE